jgi:hypothetical protein
MSQSRFLNAKCFDAFEQDEIEQDIIEWITKYSSSFYSELDTEENKSKRQRSQNVNDDVDFSETIWGKMLQNPMISKIDSKIGKVFRRRFRVPHKVYEWLVQEATDKNWFELKCKNRMKVPVEIRVLAVLRVLGTVE